MRTFQNLINLYGKNQIIEEPSVYNLPPIDIISNVISINKTPNSPIGDRIKVELSNKVGDNIKLNKLYIISTNFLVYLVNKDSTSIEFDIIESFVLNFNQADYTSYIENKILFDFSLFVEDKTNELSFDYFTLSKKDPLYNAYKASTEYFNEKQVYENFLAKFDVGIRKGTLNYEQYIKYDGTNTPISFYQKISNLYLNIQVFTYDSVFFLENVEGDLYYDEDKIYGYVIDYHNNLLDIPPYTSIYINNEPENFSINLIDTVVNKNTEFEETLGITRAKKLVFLFNISLKDISAKKEIFENIQTGYFYIIV